MNKEEEDSDHEHQESPVTTSLFHFGSPDLF